MSQAFKDKLVGTLGLFTSFGTLICCAIPSTLVLMGFGASVAGFVGKYPQLIWLSDHKGIVFGVSLGMLGISYFATKKTECPIDQREYCEGLKGKVRPLFLVSFIINCVGIFYAFGLPYLL